VRLESVLQAAVDGGWLILPDVGVPGLAATHGGVVRYDCAAPRDAVAVAVEAAIAERSAAHPPGRGPSMMLERERRAV
jgi:hypothetical protein